MNLRFSRQYYDSETHYNDFRDYNPNISRYLQSDPIGLLGGMNVYGYAGNNPLLSTDPFGLMGKKNNPHRKKDCHQLAQEIRDLIDRDKNQFGRQGIHGLVHRFNKQIYGEMEALEDS